MLLITVKWESESLPARVAWIEMIKFRAMDKEIVSLPARVAWIEILGVYESVKALIVATREGSVD